MTEQKWFPRPEDSLTGLFMPYLRKVRVEFGGETVARSDNVMLLRDGKSQGYIHYMFSTEEVDTDYIEPTKQIDRSEEKGKCHYHDVTVGGETAEKAAFTYPNEPVQGRPDLRGYYGFKWTAMDAWFEEDERVYGHPRDPYNRVDTLESSRHIRVELDDTVIAETNAPVFLFETGHPRRYYIPKGDVNMELLTATDTQWRCPYKGSATFWSISVNGTEHENLAWSYEEALKDAAEVEGLIGFYNEKLDIYVDGELEGTPETRFSSVGELDHEEIKNIAERDVVQQ